MDHFVYRDREAFCEAVPLKAIAAKVGTPCYVYSRSTLLAHIDRLKRAFSGHPSLLCYAVKANSSGGILREIFAQGLGADIVSGGELVRSLRAGAPASSIVYSGVGKRVDEIELALKEGIYSFNVESSAELDLIEAVAERMGKDAPVSLRINPNIDVKTNPKIATGLFSTKFGLVEDEAWAMARKVKESRRLRLRGVGCHIGSQILDLKPMREAAERVALFARRLQEDGQKLEFIDMGGGLGIRYRDEEPPVPELYAETLIGAVKHLGLRLLIEPGRVVVGNTGILLCSVLATKKTPQKSFVIVDGAMNDLIRPSMYDAFHEILPVGSRERTTETMDVVGPICETGDYFGKDRQLPRMETGELVYLRSTGAYGAAMASNYNSRPRAPEVLVDGDEFRVIRRRESMDDLWRLED